MRGAGEAQSMADSARCVATDAKGEATVRVKRDAKYEEFWLKY